MNLMPLIRILYLNGLREKLNHITRNLNEYDNFGL
jgi:hypothetical protein